MIIATKSDIIPQPHLRGAVMDTRQESDWKRWFTSGRSLAVATLVFMAVVATAIATLFSKYAEIRNMLVKSNEPPEIRISRVEIGPTYAADLYDLGEEMRQNLQRFWNKTLAPAETGYVAQLRIVAHKTAPTGEKCKISVNDAPLLWKWLGPTPQRYYQDWPGPWVGSHPLWIGNLESGKRDVSAEFEVFVRGQKGINVKVEFACDGAIPPQERVELTAPQKSDTRYVRVRSKWYPAVTF